MNRSMICGVAAMALLSACQQQTPTATDAGPAPDDAITARFEALKASALTMVKADEDCVLPEPMESERTVEAVDLGGGDVAVLVVCSTGTADQWSRVFVSEDNGAPVHVPLPFYKYQGADGWMTWDAMSNMSWDAATRTFAGSTRLQATGCAEGAEWRWDGARLVLARQWHMDCGAIGADDELPDPVDDFPTTPPTEQPALIAPQA